MGTARDLISTENPLETGCEECLHRATERSGREEHSIFRSASTSVRIPREKPNDAQSFGENSGVRDVAGMTFFTDCDMLR
jgi:hypothetical protein